MIHISTFTKHVFKKLGPVSESRFLVPFHDAFYTAEYRVWLINLLTTKSTHLLNPTLTQYSDIKTKPRYYSTQEARWIRHMCSKGELKTI
jgi:hypothetical protein